MKKGLFITFEGPDGSGKSTVVKAVTKRLIEVGYDIYQTREPGGVGIDIAEQIRGVILDNNNTSMDAKTEALLYAASRRQHLIEGILPALESGKHVISDRYLDSSIAYQGFGRGLGAKEILDLNQFAIEGRMPDKTIFLNVDAETGLARIQKNRAEKDRLDQASTDFHDRVYQGYQEVLKMYKDRMIVIDASQAVETVIEEAYSAVKKLLDE